MREKDERHNSKDERERERERERLMVTIPPQSHSISTQFINSW
jgi:hypothetical protein